MDIFEDTNPRDQKELLRHIQDRDSVLNHTLIDRRTNIRISNRAPSEYLAEIQRELGPESFRALLDSHLVPAGPDSPIWRDDFEGFLERRHQAIWNEIKLVTGAQEAADLVSDEEAASA